MEGRLVELKLRIEEFLICGPSIAAPSQYKDYFFQELDVPIGISGEIREFTLSTETSSCLDIVYNQAYSLAKEFSEKEFRQDTILQYNLENLYGRIVRACNEARTEKIINDAKIYVYQQHKLQLIHLAKAMQNLDGCCNILDFPDHIIRIKHFAPNIIVDGTQIKRMVEQVVAKTRSRLLEKFHNFFEDQLNEEAAANISITDGNGLGKKSMWELFMRRSRDWLLAYNLVSILPSLLFAHSRQRMLEVFQDSWDEALTPIWGRFYHHLRMARESKSFNQIIWTFSYAKSFVEMLMNLCNQITQADQMHQLCDGVDYRKAGLQQIVDKAIKFLKAHIAEVFVYVESTQFFLMELIDSIVGFDQWLTENIGLESGVEIQSSLCSVVYDSKEMFHSWMTLEQSLVYEQLNKLICSTSSNPFDLMFDSPFQAEHDADIEVLNIFHDRKLSCYVCSYLILSLFVNTRVRYSHFPPPAQWILSELILEPLLCTGIGLFLYKIRCTPELFNISIGSLSHVPECSVEWVNFSRSVSYFQSAIAYTKPNLREMRIIAGSNRCKKRWSVIQNWIPKILISEEQQRQGFDLTNLVRTSMKVPEKYRNNNCEYRQEWLSLQHDVDSLDDCVIMTRGLAITLVNVLEKQLSNL